MNKNIFNNKIFLITGGTGSFGKRFVNRILEDFNPKKVIIYSRDELKQSEMEAALVKYRKKLRFFIGDVRDLKRLILASENVDFLVHSAALKHVRSGEYNPFEVIKTNIMGTQNVIDAVYFNKIPKAIFLSTDKAVSPINLYGATKLASEKLFIASNSYSINSKLSVVKYGNVFNSRGSVFPVFLKQKKKDELLKLTHKEMTRFNISLDEGVDLVLFTLQDMRGGETYIPKMRSFRILDLVKIFQPKKGYKITGIRPGEKLHEELISPSDSSVKIEFDKYFVILPSTIENKNIPKFMKNIKSQKGKILKTFFHYNSLNADNFLTIKELEKITSSLN